MQFRGGRTSVWFRELACRNHSPFSMQYSSISIHHKRCAPAAGNSMTALHNAAAAAAPAIEAVATLVGETHASNTAFSRP